MGLMQKDENEVVTVTINGGGPIGTILCVGQSNGHVKGFCSNSHYYERYPDAISNAATRIYAQLQNLQDAII